MLKLIFSLLAFSCNCYGQEIKKISSKGMELFYEEKGKGSALYILTGGPGAPPEDPSYRIMDSLAAHYTVVLLHQRGAGRSRHIPINPQTINIKSYLEDIELLRQKRKDKKITLLGISWGGLLAMNYAVKYPASVSNLVLIGSAPPSYKLWHVLFDNQYVRRSKTELDSLEQLMKIFSSKSDRELDSLKRYDPSNKEVLAFKQFMAIHVRAMYYQRQKLPADFDTFFREFNFQPIPIIDREVMETKWDITAGLKKLDLPALILYGRQDDQGESTFFLQQSSLKNSRLLVIEQCGHIMWEDQPQAFYKALMHYLVPKKLPVKPKPPQ